MKKNKANVNRLNNNQLNYKNNFRNSKILKMKNKNSKNKSMFY